MQKILVPTDFSELSENALKMAVKLAEKNGATIHLINFYDHPFGATFSTMGEVRTGLDEAERFALELVRKNLQRLGALSDKYSSVDINFTVYDEDYSDGIQKYIKEESIDLVIMGTSGEQTAQEYFTGNHAEKMITSASCPVITIKGKNIDLGFEQIVMGIEAERDSEDNYPKAIEYLSSFCKAVGGHLHLVHVADLGSDLTDSKASIQAFIDSLPLENYTLEVTQNDNKEQGLIAYALGTGASLLVVLTHAERGFFKIFTESTAEELSKTSSIPVMAINLHNI